MHGISCSVVALDMIFFGDLSLQDLVQIKASDADDEIDEAVQEEDLELNKELMLLPLGLLKPDVAFPKALA